MPESELATARMAGRVRRGSSDSAARGGWPASSTRMAGRTESFVTCTMYQDEPSASVPPPGA